MSENENKPVEAVAEKRTVEQINADYNLECARLGDIVFKAAQMQAKQMERQSAVEEKIKLLAKLANEAKEAQK